MSKKNSSQFFELPQDDYQFEDEDSDSPVEGIFLAIEEQNLDEDQALSFKWFVFLGFPASSHRETLSSFLEKHQLNQLDKEFSYGAISAREAPNAGVDITLAGWGVSQQPRSFLTVPGGHAIIDPGASQDPIGLESYKKLCDRLAKNNLKPIRLDTKPAPAAGVGGSTTPLFESLCPCILGGQAGLVRLSILEEDIPQLLSMGLLEHSGAVN